MLLCRSVVCFYKRISHDSMTFWRWTLCQMMIWHDRVLPPLTDLHYHVVSVSVSLSTHTNLLEITCLSLPFLQLHFSDWGLFNRLVSRWAIKWPVPLNCSGQRHRTSYEPLCTLYDFYLTVVFFFYFSPKKPFKVWENNLNSRSTY